MGLRFLSTTARGDIRQHGLVPALLHHYGVRSIDGYRPEGVFLWNTGVEWLQNSWPVVVVVAGLLLLGIFTNGDVVGGAILGGLSGGMIVDLVKSQRETRDMLSRMDMHAWQKQVQEQRHAAIEARRCLAGDGI